MDATNGIFYIVILVMSVVIHEISHGFMAEYFGDNTARYAGRLTINPLKHLDLFGSILLPVLLVFTHSPFLVGWAKPVPYNPENLSNRKWGTIAVAAAGVLANFALAVIFALLIRLAPRLVFLFAPEFILPDGFYFIASAIVFVNLGLGVFNLIPLAPLDGSKIFLSFLPGSFVAVSDFVENYSFILLIVFIVYFSKFLSPIISYTFRFLTGLSF